MNKTPLAVASLALAAFGLVALTSVRQPTTSASGAGRQTPSTGIRLSQQSITGIELVSAVPVEMDVASDIVELTFRNATGQDVLAFAFSRGESPTPAAPQEFFARSFGLTYEPRVWAAGAVATVKQPREADAPVRVNAVEFSDGRVIGESGPALTLKEDRRQFAEGLASALKDVKARLARAGHDRRARGRAVAEMLAEMDAHNTAAHRRNNNPRPDPAAAGTPPMPKVVVTGNKNSQSDLVVAAALRQLAGEVGEENALEALAAGLEKAAARNTFKDPR